MTPGDRIKNRRIELGLTLEELGKRVGVGKSTVRKWETGYIANMRRDKIAKLAEALDVSPLYIMGIESPEENEPAEEGKLTEKQSELLDLISSLSDSEISVLLAAARSLIELHRSPDGQGTER